MIHLIKKFFHIVDIQTVGLDDEAEPVNCLRNSIVDNDIVVVIRLLKLLSGDGKALLHRLFVLGVAAGQAALPF